MPYSAGVLTRLMVTVAGLLGCGHGSALDAPAAPDDEPRPVTKSATRSVTAIGPDADKTDVSSAIGKPAPAWETTTWFNSPPLAVQDLRGKVVLVRWFMSSECPYCSKTAPSLVKLDDEYARKGLTIVGMYHHKSEGPMVLDDVKELVLDHYKFKFPVAIDEGWKTLKSWWLIAHPDSWTSVSFVLDKKGVVRFMHLGGEYPPDSADYEQMKRWIEELLTEPA